MQNKPNLLDAQMNVTSAMVEIPGLFYQLALVKKIVLGCGHNSFIFGNYFWSALFGTKSRRACKDWCGCRKVKKSGNQKQQGAEQNDPPGA